MNTFKACINSLKVHFFFYKQFHYIQITNADICKMSLLLQNLSDKQDLDKLSDSR